MKILFLYMYVKYVLNVFIGDLFNTLKVNSYPKKMPNASYVLLFDGQLYIWKTCHKNVSKVILNVSHC